MMKRLLILITPLVWVSHSFADQIDDIVQDAIKHGAHGKTYAQMRDLVELGAHYDARRGVWTSFNNEAEEKAFVAQQQRQEQRQWLYVDQSGYLNIQDQNGEIHRVAYDYLRVLRRGGHAVKSSRGRHITQYHLLNGQWIGVPVDE
jgi:hypothetical protein